jgi:hypothetical protein
VLLKKAMICRFVCRRSAGWEAPLNQCMTWKGGQELAGASRNKVDVLLLFLTTDMERHGRGLITVLDPGDSAHILEALA